jgi:hypothetical protein
VEAEWMSRRGQSDDRAPVGRAPSAGSSECSSPDHDSAEAAIEVTVPSPIWVRWSHSQFPRIDTTSNAVEPCDGCNLASIARLQFCRISSCGRSAGAGSVPGSPHWPTESRPSTPEQRPGRQHSPRLPGFPSRRLIPVKRIVKDRRRECSRLSCPIRGRCKKRMSKYASHVL